MPLALKCHPAYCADFIDNIEVEVGLSGSILQLDYMIAGDIAQISLADPTIPVRADNLWQTTCCEAFLGAMGQGDYFEYNLSPSTAWAAYSFSGYRKDMAAAMLRAEPQIEQQRSRDQYHLSARLELAGLPGWDAAQLELGLSAVIEDRYGQKSYWALQHPPGDPDFHHRDCFIHQLKAAA